jgi:hypothetical protein
MLQTLNMLSNGDVCINIGSANVDSDHVYSQEVLEIIDAIQTTIALQGISELHCEKDTFRQFEHAVKGGVVTSNAFGTTVSEGDFALIMSSIADQLAAEAAEAAAAEAAAATA